MFKRALDVVAALSGLLLLAPLFLLIALAIKLESRGPGVLQARTCGPARPNIPDLQISHDDRRATYRRRAS